MAASNSTTNPGEFFEYRQPLWGDLIYATKNLLQKIGIGAGMAFPGEDGGPKKTLRTTDPRGFSCKVEEASYRGAGVFCASIPFPGREQLYGLSDWKYFAPGVQRKAMYWTDDFIGSADDLVSAGLVPAGHFPGLSGMRKAVVTILPNGSLSDGKKCPRTAGERHGRRSIEKAAGGKFLVSIEISQELATLRGKEANRLDAEWEEKMKKLPRPQRIDGPLRFSSSAAVDGRRSSLRLVWSKPRFVPEFNLTK
jgi:hypothetical protein